MDNMKHRRLQELDRSDFEIVDGEPDIRGWDVKAADGRKIGEVEELIVDAQQKQVRYMVVDLDDNELKLDHKKVLLPIGTAELHREDDDVILSSINETGLRSLPDYHDDELTPEVERRICDALGRRSDSTERSDAALRSNVAGSSDLPQDFYTHDYYNSDNLYKNRMHEAQPASSTRQDSDYERGLKLWERRSEGGLISDSSSERQDKRNDDRYISENERLEMVRNRRRDYEQRRSGGLGRDTGEYTRKDNSIERRIRDEGLRDG